jgi:glycine/D-amino acid oxidase-like deaminating enzyme
MKRDKSKHIIIIGGGVTGIVTAYRLSNSLKDNFTISLIDPYDPQILFQDSLNQQPYEICHAPSFAGPLGLEPESAQIWNGPGTQDRISEGRTNPFSTLKVSKEVSKELGLWLNSFASWDEDHNDIKLRTEKLYTFNKKALIEFKKTFSKYALRFGMAMGGNLRIFEDDYSLNNALTHMDIINSLGAEAKFIKTQNIPDYKNELLPYIKKNNVFGAVYYPQDGRIDGLKFLKFIYRQLVNSNNVKIFHTIGVKSIKSYSATKNVVKLSDNSILEAEYVVVAAGLGSRALLKELNFDLPVGPVWGWSCKFSKNSSEDNNNTITVGLETPCMIISDFGSYIKAGGTTEITEDYNTPPDYSKVNKQLVENVKQFYTDRLDLESLHCRAGRRAMTVDDLPVIGSMSDSSNILLAIPTGHLGYLQSALIAKTIENIINKSRQPITIKDYSPDRFLTL